MSMSADFRAFSRVAVTAAVCLFVAGCRPQEQITSYTVDKPRVVYENNHVEREMPRDEIHGFGPAGSRPSGITPPFAGGAMSGSKADHRMLGAIVRWEGKMWYFKMMGPDRDVLDQIEEFLEFTKSLRFEENAAAPSWSVPVGWEEGQSDSTMRYATLVVSGSDPKLELTVIPLPGAPEEPQADLLANINRWRGQVGLEDIEDFGTLVRQSKVDEIRQEEINGLTVTLVNFAGPEAPSRRDTEIGPSGPPSTDD